MATKAPTVIPARPRRAIVAQPQALSSPLPLEESQEASRRVHAADDFAEKVDVYVPRAFPFTLDDHRIVQINIGVQPMPRAWADHWFVKAQGVVVYDRSQH